MTSFFQKAMAALPTSLPSTQSIKDAALKAKSEVGKGASQFVAVMQQAAKLPSSNGTDLEELGMCEITPRIFSMYFFQTFRAL